MRVHRPTLLLVALGLLAACGQKPGVMVEPGPLALAPTEPVTSPTTEAPGALDEDVPGDDEVVTDLDDDAGAAAPQEATAGGSSAGGAQQAAPRQGAGSAGSSGEGASGASATDGPRGARGSDRTGVTDDVITIGFHAPVTGAAPLPATVFRDAADLYWRWLEDVEGEDVLGRRVEVTFRDDRYEPTTARQVCREQMTEVFLLAGAGADGISACGQLAEQTRVPYFGIGGGEVGLRDNSWFSGLLQSYDQQGTGLARHTAEDLGARRAAIVATDTRNFDGGVASWEAGLEQMGVENVATLRHPRGNRSWYSNFANQLGEADPQVVYMMTSPLDWILFAQAAQDQGHDFHYLTFAPGTLNAVLGNGCPSISRASGMSGWPALDRVDDFDPDFREAVQRFGISPTNLDLALGVWGTSQALHELFLAYEREVGTDLTREDFRQVVESAQISMPTLPDASFAPDRRFGSQGSYLVEADCDTEQWLHLRAP